MRVCKIVLTLLAHGGACPRVEKCHRNLSVIPCYHLETTQFNSSCIWASEFKSLELPHCLHKDWRSALPQTSRVVRVPCEKVFHRNSVASNAKSRQWAEKLHSTGQGFRKNTSSWTLLLCVYDETLSVVDQYLLHWLQPISRASQMGVESDLERRHPPEMGAKWASLWL